MSKSTRTLIAVLVLVAVLMGTALTAALAIDLGDMVKVFGVGFVVSRFGDEINGFINDALRQREAEVQGATKVVPIVSVGQGAFIGAAQVVGVPSEVKKVQAVAQGEAGLGRLSGRLFLPISTKTPHKSIQRVRGVGVSAVIDIGV